MNINFLDKKIKIPFGKCSSDDSFLEKLLEMLPVDTRVVEVGCHKGFFTKQIMKKFKSSSCTFFEGDRKNFLDLKNHIDKTVNIYNVVLYNEQKKLKWYSAGGLSCLKMPLEMPNLDIVSVSNYMVETDTLDEVAKPFDFIKIDAEGSDFNILQGSKKLIKENKPLIYFEYTGKISAGIHGYNLEKFISFFEDINYDLYFRDGTYFSTNHWTSSTEDLNNILAIPKDYTDSL